MAGKQDSLKKPIGDVGDLLNLNRLMFDGDVSGFVTAFAEYVTTQKLVIEDAALRRLVDAVGGVPQLPPVKAFAVH